MATIEIPTLPNFVTVTTHGESVKVDVARMSEDEIDALGRKWAEAFKAHAKQRRVNAERENRDAIRQLAQR
jgi:hypothetical protein